MRSQAFFLVSLTICGCLAAADAIACGESVFRVGKGTHFRAFSAPIPGTLLVYARSDRERAVAEQLRDAGHKVLVVNNDLDLARQLQHQPFDVIVAPAEKQVAVESGASGLADPPDWLPVFETGGNQMDAINAHHGRGVSVDDDVRKYLKAIHQTVKKKDR